MSKTVEFFFDLGSPASYLAHTQLPDLCRDAGAALVYRPMLLGGVFQATGNASPAMIPAKGRYMIRDLARFAERYGVPMRFNRLVLLRPWMWHSAGEAFGSTLEDGRLVYLMFFNRG